MSTVTPEEKKSADVSVSVEPGICGFDCVINVYRIDKRTVKIEISGSECKQIRRLSAELDEMSLKELFTPMTRNPVYAAAQKSGCHPSCVLPTAVLKAVEAALEMALPRDVRVCFHAPCGDGR